MVTEATLPAELEDAVADVAAAIVPGRIDAGAGLALEHKRRVATAALITGYRYAPGAPLELHVEAAIRFGNWLARTDPALTQKTVSSADGTSLTYAYASTGAGAGFRRSGARVLLSPYRIRRMA